MKNLKKVAAFGLAAAMAMSMGVSAFAEVSVASTNSNFGSYQDGVAKLANTDMIDANNQWTVVLIDADKATANLTAEDLYYINQGTSADDFWLTNGMGTKVDLATLVDETTTTKDFIIRIGGDTITDATGIIEIPFTLTYSTSGGVPTYTLGDVDEDGYIGSTDALIALQLEIGDIEESSLSEGQLLAADVDEDGYIGSPDALEMINCELGMSDILNN